MSNTDASTLADRLRSVPLFADLDDAALERIAQVAQDFDADAGHVLIQPRTAGMGLFVLEEGAVAVQGHERIELGPGDVFGELALLDEGATRSARVQATTGVRGLCIRREDFTDLLADEPRIALSLARILARRLAAMMDHH